MDALKREQNAYAAYAEIYAQQNPPPAKPDVRDDRFYIMVALAVMVGSSVVVSASRTIYEFGGGYIGVAAFVMLEVGLVLYAYVRTELTLKDAGKSHLKTIKRFINAGMFLSLFVLLAGNLHAVLKSADLSGVFVDALDVIVPVLIAVSAPLLAFISGDVLGMMAVQKLHARRKIDQDHQVAMDEWRTGLNEAWKRGKGAFMQKFVRSLSTTGHRTDNRTMDGQRTPDGQPDTGRTADGHADAYGHRVSGYGRTTDARTLIADYFTDNPDAIHESVREIAEKLGVGKSTVAEVKREWIRSVRDD